MHRWALAIPAERHQIHPSSPSFPVVRLLHASVGTSWRFSLWVEVAQARHAMHASLASCIQRGLAQRTLWTAIRGSGRGDMMTS